MMPRKRKTRRGSDMSWFWREHNLPGNRVERRVVVYEDKDSGLTLELTKKDLQFLLDLGKWDPMDDGKIPAGKLVRG